MRTASVKAIGRAGEFLRGLSSAAQTYSLYPPGHPDRRARASDLLATADRLRDAVGSAPVLFSSRRRLYLGNTLLAWESLTLLRLATLFESSDVESFELPASVREDALDALVRKLVREPVEADELDQLAINKAGPAIRAEVEQGMAELLNSYAVGLELLRETGARLLAGERADIDATRRVTETLADQISSDPAQALLLTTVKSHDEYTYHHMINVCILSLAMGNAIGLPREQVINLGIGGLLHDVGKVKVPQEILHHQGPLDEEQWRIIQRHPIDGTGLLLLTSRDLYLPAATVVLEHHTTYDASGYPTLGGRRQPTLLSRIVAVADCFDAVTSARPYRRAEERRQALALLQAGAGRGFDPHVVRTFVRMMGLFPIGSLVELVTGEIGVVVRNHERLLANPTLKTLIDPAGNRCDPAELDLSEQGSDGGFRWKVRRSVDPRELGVDMLAVISSEGLDISDARADLGPGLVHEPAPGERPPPGYVDSHREPRRSELDLERGPSIEGRARTSDNR